MFGRLNTRDKENTSFHDEIRIKTVLFSIFRALYVIAHVNHQIWNNYITQSTMTLSHTSQQIVLSPTTTNYKILQNFTKFMKNSKVQCTKTHNKNISVWKFNHNILGPEEHHVFTATKSHFDFTKSKNSIKPLLGLLSIKQTDECSSSLT